MSDDQNIVSPAEMQTYTDALLRLLVNFGNKRSTEQLTMLKDVVAALSLTISNLRKAGVAYSEIAKQLKTLGIEIDGDTLQDLYYEYRDQAIREFVEQRIAEDAIQKLRESSSQAAATGHTEAKQMVAPAPAPAPSPAPTKTGDSDSDGSAQAAMPSASPVKGRLPDPTTAQVARVGERDLEAILGNVIDVSKLPKRED